MSRTEIPERLTIEVPQVARYRAFEETAGGIALPGATTDHHFYFSLPGLIPVPALIYYRTRHTGEPLFTVRINDLRVTEYNFVSGDEAERTWHEIIPASDNGRPTLMPDGNEMVFFARDGEVVFGDVVILYTSNQTTVPVSVMVGPAVNAAP